MNTQMSLVQRLRSAIRLRTRARRSCYRILRRAGLLGQEWQNGLPEELQAWEFMLKDGGRNWVVSEYEFRLNPHAELQEEYKRLIRARPGQPVRVLDVGAGPLTSLGKRWEGVALEIVPIDPLAEEYNALLDRLGLTAPAPSRPGHGEKLMELFPKGSFDFALASNSLDHSYDPLLVIRQMISLVKPGCYVYLGHFANEAIAAGYTGLHQWNFRIQRGDMILDDGAGRKHSLKREFDGVASLECEIQEWVGRPAVIGKLRKLGAA